MKKCFVLISLLTLQFFETSFLSAQLTEEEEKQFAQLVEHANLLQPTTEPHVHDAQIPTWTHQLTTLFPKIITSPLPTYEEARQRLLQSAQNFDATQQKKTIFGNTYQEMIVARLASPTGPLLNATQTLLRHAVGVTFHDNDLLTLVEACHPTNPSASAVYNVLFKWTVNHLQGEIDRQKEETSLLQAFQNSLTLQTEEDSQVIRAIANSLKTQSIEDQQRNSPLSINVDPGLLWQNALRQVTDNNLHLVGELSRFQENKPDHNLMKTFLQTAPSTHMTIKQLIDELAMHILINSVS